MIPRPFTRKLSINKYRAQAIVPLNQRGAKEPPEGFDFDGTPLCSMGYRMTYWGYDASTKTHKFRCPHVLGKLNCPFGSAWYSDSSYGMVVKTKVNLGLNTVRVRGIKRVRFYQVLSCVTLIAATLAVNSVMSQGQDKIAA